MQTTTQNSNRTPIFHLKKKTLYNIKKQGGTGVACALWVVITGRRTAACWQYSPRFGGDYSATSKGCTILHPSISIER